MPKTIEPLCIGKICSIQPLTVDWNGENNPQLISSNIIPEGFDHLPLGTIFDAQVRVEIDGNRKTLQQVLSFTPYPDHQKAEMEEMLYGESGPGDDFETTDTLPHGNWAEL